eukprot:COSAG02_NODE_1353_length_13103_cov_74.629652_7_plen_447_part_00
MHRARAQTSAKSQAAGAEHGGVRGGAPAGAPCQWTKDRTQGEGSKFCFSHFVLTPHIWMAASSELQRGIASLQQAAAVDAGGDPWGSIPLYLQGLEHLNVAHKTETDPARKSTIRARMEEYMTRVEQLRAAQRATAPALPPRGDAAELPSVPVPQPKHKAPEQPDGSTDVSAGDVGAAAAVGGVLGAVTLGVAAAPLAAGALAYQTSQTGGAGDVARTVADKGWNGLTAGASSASKAAGGLGLSGDTKVGETTASGVGAAAAVGGVAAVATLGVGLGAVVAPVAAVGMAAASTQSGERGDAVRAVTGVGVKAYSTASEFDRQYDVTGKSVAAVKWTAGTATQINNDYDVTGKVQSAASAVGAAGKDAAAWAEEHKVAERVSGVASAVGAAGRDAANWAEEHKVVDKTTEVLSEVGGAATRLVGGVRSLAAGWTGHGSQEQHKDATR